MAIIFQTQCAQLLTSPHGFLPILQSVPCHHPCPEYDVPRNSSSNPCTSSKSPFMELTSAGMRTTNPALQMFAGLRDFSCNCSNQTLMLSYSCWGADLVYLAQWSSYSGDTQRERLLWLGSILVRAAPSFKIKQQFVSMCHVCVSHHVQAYAGVFVLYQYHLDIAKTIKTAINLSMNTCFCFPEQA